MSESDDEKALTREEESAVSTLQRLAHRWPRTLMLASLDGELVVLRNASGRVNYDGSINPDSVVASIRGIPNTGGSW